MSMTINDVFDARKRIEGAVYASPCPYSLSLSRLCGAQIYCKLDQLQMTGSFKERGARNKLLLLPEEARKRGVIAASAGNHALALAYHGRELNIPVTVVMPRSAPLVKVSNCRSFGATVLQDTDDFQQSRVRAMELSRERSLEYVSGFDDPAIIAGQATMGLEIVQAVPDLDAVVVPIGGGGLIAGVGLAVKSLKPNVRVIGVEPVNAPTMYESLKRGQVTRIDTKPTLADGLAVAEVGKLCFEIARKVVDDIMLVDEGQIARSILRLLENEKMVVEGAGAVPLAAAMNGAMKLAGKKVVLVLCGGNIDVSTLGKVIERGLALDGRLCRLTAKISDRPGGLAKFTALLAETGASIKEVYHDRNFGPADVSQVRVITLLETRDRAHIEQIRTALNSAGIEFSIEEG